MRRRFFIILFTLFSIAFAYAQSDPPLRIELPTAQDADDYHYALMGKEGVMVFYEGESVNMDTTEWVLMRYDTNLQRISVMMIRQAVKALFRQSYYADGKLYLLFQDVVAKKEIPLTYLSVIDVNTGEYQNYTMENIPKFEIAKLRAVDGYTVFSIINGDSYYIYFYNTRNRQLHDFTIRDAAITSEQFIEIDSVNQKFVMGLCALYPDKTATLAVYETTFQGELIREVPLPSYDGYYYNSARYKIIDSSSAIIIGTYNISKSKKTGFYHTGVYTLLYKNSMMRQTEFYNYTNLHKKDADKGVRNNEQSADLQLLISDIIANDSCYSLITEVYYPEYSYNSSYYDNMSSYYYSSSYAPTSTTFDGYRYVNAYVTCFDKDGNLLWDNYFPFANMLTHRLAQRVAIYYAPFGTAVFYPYNSSLTATLINGYEVLESVSTIPIECSNKKDVVEYSRDLNMYNWYDNNFIICGYQYIVNNTKSSRGKRYVFFMNKLQYR